MKLKLAVAALGALAAASGPAGAENFAWGIGLRDVAVPAPIPAGAATAPADGMRWGAGLKDIAVPAPIPVPGAFPVREGFSYYLRADLGWGWGKARSFEERGLIYGEDAVPAVGQFTSAAIPFLAGTDNVFGGTVGVGAYFAPRFRGDLTFDFRGDQTNVFSGTYNYLMIAPAGFSTLGSVTDTLKVSSGVGLANIYFDLLPRGAISPYIGGGIGFVYNDITRTYTNTEVQVDGTGAPTATFVRTGQGKENNYGLAAAFMAGVAFSVDHRWALDVGYRALYMDGGSASITTTSLVTGLAQQSTADLGDVWEHQVRVGLRWNIW